MDAAAGEGPEVWCYDLLETRTWDAGESEITVLRSLELVWIRFDGNPAVFANMVEGEQAIEDFLVGDPSGPTPPALLDEVRAYIRAARTPGRSTWLELAAPVPSSMSSLWWRIDGANPDACRVPGPESAGCYGSTSALLRRGIRALVRPGTHTVEIGGSVAAGDQRIDARFECSIDIAPHVGRRLRIGVDRESPEHADLVVETIA